MGKGYRVVAKAAEQEAEIFLYEDVGESFFGGVTAAQFRDNLRELGPVKNISLRINSYGGEVMDGLAIYRLLADHKAKVTTHIDGVAASIASVIAMARQQINIAEAGLMMIHNANGLVQGGAEDMRQMAVMLDTVTATLRGVYSARTKRTDDEIKAWMDKEWWFAGPDAVKNGFADKLAPNVKVSAYLSPEMRDKHNFKNVPAELLGRPSLTAAADRLERMRAQLRLSAPKAA